MRSSPRIALASAVFGAVVGICPNGGDLAVGFAHESLELFLKQLIGGFGSCGRGGSIAAAAGGTTALAAVIAVTVEIAGGLTVLAARTVRSAAALSVAVEAAAVAVTAVGIAAVAIPMEAGAAAVLACVLGAGLQTLHGKVDLACGIDGNDHDLDVLTLGQMLTDIADVGIGNLGDMYHAGLVFGKRNKSAKIGDRLDFALKDSSHC